jgi:hypothetical protein
MVTHAPGGYWFLLCTSIEISHPAVKTGILVHREGGKHPEIHSNKKH